MRISANQVTMMRILLLPVPVYLLIYGDTFSFSIAFFLLVFLGATDFIDGLMARREGPTTLGSLLDPVADKIFIASIFLTMVTMGIVPSWVASVILSREFLMTALRSSVAIRKSTVKTSKLGKIKTIIQMGGAGTIFLTFMLPQIYPFIALGLAVFFLSLALFYLARYKMPPFWVLPVFFAVSLVMLLGMLASTDVSIMVQIWVIIALTWGSAIDYLVGTSKLYAKTGMYAGDWLRIFWSIVYGIFVVPLVAYFPVMILPVLASVSLEFGLGGIDNIVVFKKNVFSLWPFIFSGLFGFIFALLVNASIYFVMPIYPFYYSLALCFISLVICATIFFKHIDLFKKNKALV